MNTGRPAPGGSRAASAARRSPARTCCRASSTRSRIRSTSTSPSDSDTFGVAARVADGVDVVVDAHDADGHVADVEAARRVRTAGRRIEQSMLARHTRSLRLELRRRSGPAAGPISSGTGQPLEHLVEEAGHDEPLGSIGRHAAALEVEALLLVDRADRPKRGCTARRCSRSRGSAPTRPTRLRRA